MVVAVYSGEVAFERRTVRERESHGEPRRCFLAVRVKTRVVILSGNRRRRDVLIGGNDHHDLPSGP